MNNEKVGKYIKSLRKEKGISQNELGKMVHVTRQAVSNWENGKTLPDSDILISLSELFNKSINTILAGGEESKDIEEVALELVNQNNKKDKIIHKMILSIYIGLISILIIFLGFYFINNYNSIKVYKVAGATNKFRINEGIIISTSQNTYFKLGHLETITKEEIKISKVKIYYKNKKEQETIFEGDLVDRLFTQKEGYNEFHKSKFEKYKNNLYVEITYNDNQTEIMNLKIEEKFKNNYIMTFDESNILRSDYENKMMKELQLAYTIEEEEYQQKYFQRLEENNEKESNIIPEPIETIVREEHPSETKMIEPEEQVHEEDIVQEEIPMVEEQPQEINYEEIINIIETHGRYERRTHILEYLLEDGTIVVISTNKNIITLEVQSQTTNKMWINNINWNQSIDYQKLKNNILIESININQENSEENQEIINEMNGYLKLVYQEME